MVQVSVIVMVIVRRMIGCMALAYTPDGGYRSDNYAKITQNAAFVPLAGES
jgi:hypothetical protein